MTVPQIELPPDFPTHLLQRPWLDELHRDRLMHQFKLAKWRPCQVDVLIVTDGADFTFGNGYTLGHVVRAMTTDLPPYVSVKVTTARHGSVPDPGGTYDVPSFRFNTTDLTGFDEIWIIAVGSGSAYNPGEMTALHDFMQSGGGVFATGDHAQLGVALCGGIPRVRSMRRWFYPNPGPNGEPVAPDSGSTRNDTTVGGSDFDGTPQIISPTMYSLGWSHHAFIRRSAPHPVLCGRNGPIRVLPDHMHEGVIEVPPLDQSVPVDGTDVEEFQRAGGVRVSPLVIATATDHQAPGGPFGVIGAYDGHLVDEVPGGVGRIVVDATWHHLFGMNVIQFAAPYDAVQAGSTNADDLKKAAYWQQIKDYFQNAAIWLARPATQRCIRRRGFWLVAVHVDVLMALRTWKLEPHERWEYFFEVGAKAKDAFHRVAPQCQVLELIIDLLDRFMFFERLRPWPLPIPDPPPLRFGQLIDPDLLTTVALGGALVAVHERIQGRLELLARVDDDIAELATAGAAEAVKLLASELLHNAEEVASLLDDRQRR